MQFFSSDSLRAAVLLSSLTVGACGNSLSINANSNPPVPSGTPPGSPASPGAPATAGSVALSTAVDTVAQTAGTVTLTVNRSGGSAGAASVHYSTSNITAVAGSNYTAASATLAWSDGDASARTIAISLSATAFSGSKTFSVTLSSASGASLGTPASATITIAGAAAAASGGPAAQLAAKLGKPSRLLVGLGGQGEVDTVAAIQSQTLKVDIYEKYLGTGDWTMWNSPPCDWICVVANSAAAVGAIPMYTQYQMANDGDGNLAGLSDSTFMATYWSRAKLMFTEIAALNKPALINFEPDFWGYAERQAPGGDPTKLAALVNTNPDCATLPNNVSGVAACLIAMARQYAPLAYVGFPPSGWGGDTTADVVAFMNAVGAQNADFVVEQTLDRDAGCREVSPQPSYCTGTGTWYWDETNQTHPNFQDHLAEAQAFHTGIGNLPIIWWQTPEGVPATTPGGTDFHYRDNRVHYFLTHPAELTAVGGLAIVFGVGENHQTNITTDGGQYQSLSGAYLAAPAPLP
jgi:Calx-beta domain